MARFSSRHGLTPDGRADVLARLEERATVSDFSAIRRLHGLTAPAQELWQDYRSDMAALASCPAGLLEGMDELEGRGWRIGIATNGSADIQRAKLSSTGIALHVHSVCVSAEVGVRKPDPRLFVAAAELCGAVPGNGGWMVGNDPAKDILGGRAAGLATLWIGDPLRWPADLPAPDRTAPTALQAIRLLLNMTA